MIAIGITGHRPHKLNPERLDVIARQIMESLAAIESRNEAKACMLVCSLAEGADTMAAEAALKRGWSLTAPLPFPARHYARDFHVGAPRETFARLEGIATTIPCTDDRDALDDDTDGYIAASRAMLEKSDALIAIWNGAPTHLKAGAYDTLMLALGQAMPVLWIDANGIAPPASLFPEDMPLLKEGKRPAERGEKPFLAALR